MNPTSWLIPRSSILPLLGRVRGGLYPVSCLLSPTPTKRLFQQALINPFTHPNLFLAGMIENYNDSLRRRSPHSVIQLYQIRAYWT